RNIHDDEEAGRDNEFPTKRLRSGRYRRALGDRLDKLIDFEAYADALCHKEHCLTCLFCTEFFIEVGTKPFLYVHRIDVLLTFFLWRLSRRIGWRLGDPPLGLVRLLGGLTIRCLNRAR